MTFRLEDFVIVMKKDCYCIFSVCYLFISNYAFVWNNDVQYSTNRTRRLKKTDKLLINMQTTLLQKINLSCWWLVIVHDLDLRIQSRSSSTMPILPQNPQTLCCHFFMCFWPYFLLFFKVNKHHNIAKFELLLLRQERFKFSENKQTDKKTDTVIHKRVVGDTAVCSCSRWFCSSGSCKSVDNC